MHGRILERVVVGPEEASALHKQLLVNEADEARRAKLRGEVEAALLATEAQRKLLNFVRRKKSGISQDEAERLVQEGITRTLESVAEGAYQGGNAMAYARTTITRLIIGEHRHNEVLERDAGADINTLKDENDSQLDALIRVQEHKRLRSALGELPPDYRKVLTLKYFDDLSMEEIALRLGATEDAVRMMLHRGRKRLRALLEEKPRREAA